MSHFEKLSKCPVCEVKLLKRAVVNHVLGMARGEAFKSMMLMIEKAVGKPYTFSPRVCQRFYRHLGLVSKSIRQKPYFKINDNQRIGKIKTTKA